MSIVDSIHSVNVGKSIPTRPDADAPDCPECLDTQCWVLNAQATAYFPVCPWCAGFEFGGGFDPNDDPAADTVCEPTPLAPREG